jgi:hypothetical protein
MALGGVGVLGLAWLRLGCIPARANGKWQIQNVLRTAWTALHWLYFFLPHANEMMHELTHKRLIAGVGGQA